MTYNTFPTLDQWVGTKYTPRFGMQERLASNGAVRLRALQSAPKFDITVVFSLVTQANHDLITAFYTANRTAPFLFTATEDGVQRIVVFAANAYNIEPLDSSLYKITMYLREI